MLYEYLTNHYQPNEPIFASDIDLPIKPGTLRQMFKTLCDSGKLKRFDSGVYYLPKQSRLKGGTSIAADTVVRYKYIARNGKIDGYYTGYTFANQLGLTTQVPYMTEIVSNNASSRVRTVELQGRKVLLRKSRVPVTSANYRVLQFLDLLKDVDQYADSENQDTAAAIRKYVKDEQIKRQDVDLYLPEYPDRIYRQIYEMRLYDVFA